MRRGFWSIGFGWEDLIIRLYCSVLLCFEVCINELMGDGYQMVVLLSKCVVLVLAFSQIFESDIYSVLCNN